VAGAQLSRYKNWVYRPAPIQLNAYIPFVYLIFEGVMTKSTPNENEQHAKNWKWCKVISWCSMQVLDDFLKAARQKFQK